jgi:outer membrane protein assembly factor BamB
VGALPEEASESGTPVTDAGALPIPASDAGARAPALPCTPTSAPGTIAWQTSLGGGASLDGGGMVFEGPLATDDAGTTYFLGTVGQYPSTYTVVALDSCGRQLWETAGTKTGLSSQVRTSVFVNGDQVVVQWDAVDAFDRATGRHLWNVDLNTIAGEDLAGDDSAEIGPSAAAADGTTFVVFETSSLATLVAISPGGAPTTVATTPDDGDLISLIVDAAGQLDILFNSAIDGAYVESFTRAGARAFSDAFSCNAGFLGTLASASDFLVMQTGPCVLTLQGAQGFSPTPAPPNDGDYAGIVIDAQNNLYANGSSSTLFSFDDGGHERWMVPLANYAVGGPLLGAGGQLFVVEVNLSTMPAPTVATFVAIDASTGALAWSRDVPTTGNPSILGYLPVLLTAAQQLVIISDNLVTSVAAGQRPSADAEWPTPLGGPDQRAAALGQ